MRLYVNLPHRCMRETRAPAGAPAPLRAFRFKVAFSDHHYPVCSMTQSCFVYGRSIPFRFSLPMAAHRVVHRAHRGVSQVHPAARRGEERVRREQAQVLHVRPGAALPRSHAQADRSGRVARRVQRLELERRAHLQLGPIGERLELAHLQPRLLGGHIDLVRVDVRRHTVVAHQLEQPGHKAKASHARPHRLGHDPTDVVHVVVGADRHDQPHPVPLAQRAHALDVPAAVDDDALAARQVAHQIDKVGRLLGRLEEARLGITRGATDGDVLAALKLPEPNAASERLLRQPERKLELAPVKRELAAAPTRGRPTQLECLPVRIARLSVAAHRKERLGQPEVGLVPVGRNVHRDARRRERVARAALIEQRERQI
eukprot:3952527-Prymnesium_polylepis.1